MQLDIESKHIFELRSQFTINYHKYKSESLQNEIMNSSSNPIWPVDKQPLPNEFDLWIKTHANESGPNIPTKMKRKKSVLSMVSFLEESSSEEEDEAPLTPPPKEIFPTLPVLNSLEYHVNIPERKIRLRRQPAITSTTTRSIPTNNSPIKIPEIETKKKKSFPTTTTKRTSWWFKNLFKKNKSEIFSGLFTPNNTYPIDQPKKKTLKKNKERVQRIPLTTRYPLDTERAVYQLSHLKLNNIRRPLQQQVVISNMMYWYLSITDQIEYQNSFRQEQRPTSPPLSTIKYSPPPPVPVPAQEQGEHRPASPPPNDVSTKSNKKKYKPVPNTEYVSQKK